MLKFDQVVLEITNNCNNHCNHCYNYWRSSGTSPHYEKELSREQIFYLINKVRKETPLENIAITGGEPFLRSDLQLIIRDITLLGIEVVLITNGTLITRERIKSFPKDTVFEVTLFSYKDTTHNSLAGRKCFDKVLESFVCIKKNKFSLAVAIVITKQNYADIEETIKLAIALGADSILLNRINLSKNSMVFANELVPSVKELTYALNAANKCVKKYGVGMAVSVPIPPCLINPEDFPNLIFGWCPRGNREAYYTIGNTGEVRPCNHSSVILGNLFLQDFKEIVNSNTAKKYWKQIPLQCKDCDNLLKDKCKGGCIAACYECNGYEGSLDPFITFSNN